MNLSLTPDPRRMPAVWSLTTDGICRRDGQLTPALPFHVPPLPCTPHASEPHSLASLSQENSGCSLVQKQASSDARAPPAFPAAPQIPRSLPPQATPAFHHFFKCLALSPTTKTLRTSCFLLLLHLVSAFPSLRSQLKHHFFRGVLQDCRAYITGSFAQWPHGTLCHGAVILAHRHTVASFRLGWLSASSSAL